MRARGKVVYYESYQGKGFVKESKTGEFYLITRRELRETDILLYTGLEITFHPCLEDNETVAEKIRIAGKLKRGYIARLNREENKGYIADRQGKQYWFKPSETILMGCRSIHENDNVQFFASHGDHPVQYAYEVACDKRMALSKFAFKRNWDEPMTALAALAEEETWSYVNFETEPFPLLKNYIVHTFQNVFEQDRISYFTDAHSGVAYACFQTGLVSKNNEDIYGMFAKTVKDIDDPYAPYDWVFTRFTDQWRYILLQCVRSPLAANYRCRQGYDCFDTALEIRTNMDILMDQAAHLLPKKLLMQGYEQCAAVVKQSIGNTGELLRTGEIVPVAKYFRGRIEFTAPLYFDGKQADVALVIKRCDEGVYLANNLIPPDIAYKNARLLGPVKSDWLKPVYTFSDIPVEQEYFQV